MKSPKIRFKGFDGDWEQRKLGELCSEIGDGLHSAPIYDENGEYYFINGNNLVNGKIVIDTTETNRVSKETFMKNDKSLDDKTILLSINGTIGNLAYYGDEKVMLGKSAAYLKAQNIAKEFLYASLQTSIVMDSFMLSLTGTTIKNLGLEAIKNTKIYIPRIKEQQQIGTYFKNLDHLITLHQKKCEQLTILKKYMLQKMFPQNGSDKPEIRFDGFTDDWEQRKLGDVVDSVDTGKSKFNKEDSSGEYPILGSTSVIGYDDKYDYEGDFILTARVGANAGNLYRHAGKVKISDNTVFIQTSQNIEFLYQLLIQFDVKKLSFGTGQPLVKASELKNLELMMPTDMKEQMRIGMYLKNLDNLITLHQNKCNELKELKKFMLQNMFV